MNILLAEDDSRLGELIVHMLKKKANYQVDWVMTGNDACDYALASHYDVLIMDWMMPDGNGVDACRKLRKSGYSGAVLMLTAKDALEDRIEGLDAGADDYLIKPFEIAELLARIRALSRRNYAPITEEVVHFQDIKLFRTGFSVQKGVVTIQLTPREFQLLDLLAHNKGQVLTREVILDRIWGYDADVSAKIVDATIKLLRKKLEPFGSEELIQSIRGVGYKLEG
ncbi:DNA-binding response regulator, OmpR family, contains REC and winged-helix (wHTH) domain [Paenibacillus sp. 1_12]|uniref:response regulator transcription factor n=1 Tax=Paenibacillus sp. 1_12 TaxID=1566278 RepID=UPI0008F3C838|nr:response regulator transcription factor [Paenibacillus sp. 1_12]SFL37697.1 DNA-binding response regulator, OmpR family, contains REC and winged-helix (wHTH) domain [Paenibacillus sp. 1_12]